MPTTELLADHVLASALHYAKLAGAALLERPDKLEIATKSSATDVVTHMDELAEKIIVAGITADFPDDGILGEEGADVKSTSGYQWIIDPLDGTINYLYGLPAWAVSIARVDLHTGDAQVGVVYAPAMDRLYFAKAGHGSYLNDFATPLRVGECTVLSQALVGTGFGYDSKRRAGQARVLNTVLPNVRDIRRIGSCALDLCFVAQGLLDMFFERGVNPWDHAAGGLIAREAGAIVSGLNNKTESSEMLVATNRFLHANICELLESVSAESDQSI
jgi:myo-inositol-1(or 4)-monophosphatase